VLIAGHEVDSERPRIILAPPPKLKAAEDFVEKRAYEYFCAFPKQAAQRAAAAEELDVLNGD